MKKRLLSLFSGCGGMDLGFEGDFLVKKTFINEIIHTNWFLEDNKNDFVKLKKTTFDIVFANDILLPAKNAWIPFFNKRGINKEIFHDESIVDLVKKYKNNEFTFPENIDIVIGGFPCQDFSVAGKRKGFKSTKTHNNKNNDTNSPNIENRGQLYIWMKEVIEITKPKIFYAENVKGLVSLENVKEIIENDFKNIDDGYIIVPTKVLNVADYGIPQNRERIIFIGLNKKYLKKTYIEDFEKGNIPNQLNPYPIITHFNNKVNNINDSNLIPYSTCKMALDDLKEPEESTDLAQQSYSKAKFMKNYQGSAEIKLNFLAPTIRAEHHGNIEYRRLSETNGGKYHNELKQYRERRLTVRECARLQTFPDNYEFVRQRRKNEEYNLSASGAYKVIGNAVPPLFAYHLAKRIEELWEDLFDN